MAKIVQGGAVGPVGVEATQRSIANLANAMGNVQRMAEGRETRRRSRIDEYKTSVIDPLIQNWGGPAMAAKNNPDVFKEWARLTGKGKAGQDRFAQGIADGSITFEEGQAELGSAAVEGDIVTIDPAAQATAATAVNLPTEQIGPTPGYVAPMPSAPVAAPMPIPQSPLGFIPGMPVQADGRDPIVGAGPQNLNETLMALQAMEGIPRDRYGNWVEAQRRELVERAKQFYQQENPDMQRLSGEVAGNMALQTKEFGDYSDLAFAGLPADGFTNLFTEKGLRKTPVEADGRSPEMAAYEQATGDIHRPTMVGDKEFIMNPAASEAFRPQLEAMQAAAPNPAAHLAPDSVTPPQPEQYNMYPEGRAPQMSAGSQQAYPTRVSAAGANAMQNGLPVQNAQPQIPTFQQGTPTAPEVQPPTFTPEEWAAIEEYERVLQMLESKKAWEAQQAMAQAGQGMQGQVAPMSSSQMMGLPQQLQPGVTQGRAPIQGGGMPVQADPNVPVGPTFIDQFMGKTMEQYPPQDVPGVNQPVPSGALAELTGEELNKLSLSDRSLYYASDTSPEVRNQIILSARGYEGALAPTPQTGPPAGMSQEEWEGLSQTAVTDLHSTGAGAPYTKSLISTPSEGRFSSATAGENNRPNERTILETEWKPEFGEVTETFMRGGDRYVRYKTGDVPEPIEGQEEVPTIDEAYVEETETIPDPVDNRRLGQGVQDSKKANQLLVRSRPKWSGGDTAPGLNQFMQTFYPDGAELIDLIMSPKDARETRLREQTLDESIKQFDREMDLKERQQDFDEMISTQLGTGGFTEQQKMAYDNAQTIIEHARDREKEIAAELGKPVGDPAVRDAYGQWLTESGMMDQLNQAGAVAAMMTGNEMFTGWAEVAAKDPGLWHRFIWGVGRVFDRAKTQDQQVQDYQARQSARGNTSAQAQTVYLGDVLGGTQSAVDSVTAAAERNRR